MIRENDYNKKVDSLRIKDKKILDENKEEFLLKFKDSFISSIKGLFIYCI